MKYILLPPPFIIAAIKGYWRSGAIPEQICVVTGIDFHVIEYLIKQFTELKIHLN